jgi:hypothetical protein
VLRIADAPGTDPPGHRHRDLADQLARLSTDDRRPQNLAAGALGDDLGKAFRLPLDDGPE